MPRLFKLWLLVISVGSCVKLTVCFLFYSFLFSFEHLVYGTTRCASSQRCLLFTFFLYFQFGPVVSKNTADIIHHWKDSSRNGCAWHLQMSVDSSNRRKKYQKKKKGTNVITQRVPQNGMPQPGTQRSLNCFCIMNYSVCVVCLNISEAPRLKMSDSFY